MRKTPLHVTLILGVAATITLVLVLTPLVLESVLGVRSAPWAIWAAPGRQSTPQPAVYLPVVLKNAELKLVPTPTPMPNFGMRLDQRFHDIHVNRLQLRCDFCHVGTVETYYDPLAQVFNLADRRACLSCHKEGGVRPFYGEEWDEAQVGR